jgi:hypothetical protein
VERGQEREIERETERDRERQRERQRDRERERARERSTEGGGGPKSSLLDSVQNVKLGSEMSLRGMRLIR